MEEGQCGRWNNGGKTKLKERYIQRAGRARDKSSVTGSHEAGCIADPAIKAGGDANCSAGMHQG